MSASDEWRLPISWAEAAKGIDDRFEAPAEILAVLGARLDVLALSFLAATVRSRPWCDGLEIEGHIEARATRTCVVSLEPLEERISASFRRRVVPQGSANAPAAQAEVSIDLDGDDPPDVAGPEGLDLGPMIAEELALALEPFPRAPGAAFEHDGGEDRASPFAGLGVLRSRG